MKFVFLTNYYNHHQKYISNKLNEICSYCFVATSKMREERKALGYGEEYVPQYVISYDETTKKQIKKDIELSDVVIWGSAPQKLIRFANKLVFRYAERPLRRKSNFFKVIARFIKWHTQYSSAMYLLCASAYTAWDYSKYGLFKKKSYKWGYFPHTIFYDVESLIANKRKNHILWCGRFLELKHPDDVICVAKKLFDENYSFTIDFIGTGAMEDQLKGMIKGTELEKCISFLGSMSPDDVRSHMEKAGIYLFTSDKQEGWGAVLNESMNSGCAVVASHAIGSVPYLLENNVNGLIYESGNVDMLYEKVKYLLDNSDEQTRLGKAAYRTITELWNAEVAAERLVKLSECILEGDIYPDLYETGPCSKASILKDDWFSDDRS